MRSLRVPLAVMALSLSLAGCGLGQGLHFTSMQLGKSVNADATVAAHTTVFSPTDTIYVSVLTTGAGSGEVAVRWKYGEQVVGEPKKPVSYRDVAATGFHLQSAGGFPVGAYTVEAFLNGQSVGTRAFKVEK